MGDPSGIGPEVLVKGLRRARRIEDAAFFVLGDSRVLKRFGFRPAANVRLVGCREAVPGVSPAGLPSHEGAAASVAYLEEAVRLLRRKACAGLVTGPVSKKNIEESGTPFSGHTEFLMRRFGVKEVAMVFVGRRLKVALVTRHLSLREAAAAVSAKRIVACGRLSFRLLKERFGVSRPRIAVCGLNPHAGEGGLFGDEEERHIVPAIRSLNRQMRGSFSGPWPADTVFHRACCGDFDLVMAMYHDQGLCAFKALDFSSGAQISAGLPFVRTSPVHGTAFDIAGKNIADAGSMETALRLAVELSRRSR
jgi:4-hydroxythreonine-4-phosphate dehydrogenase